MTTFDRRRNIIRNTASPLLITILTVIGGVSVAAVVVTPVKWSPQGYAAIGATIAAGWAAFFTWFSGGSLLEWMTKWREEDEKELAEVLQGRGKAAADYLREFLGRPVDNLKPDELIVEHVWVGLEYLASEVDRVSAEIIQAQVEELAKSERRSQVEEQAFRTELQMRYSEVHSVFWGARDALADMDLPPITRDLVLMIKSWKDALPSKYPTKNARVHKSR